jgi:sugar lactone lactonase YvrE
MPEVRTAFEAKDTLGEAPLWCTQTQRLWWVDIQKATLRSLDPETGVNDSYQLPGKSLGSFGFHRDGGFVVALDNAMALYHPDRGVTPLCEPEPDMPGNRLNDGKVDRRGRYWVGSMDREIREPAGSLHSINPDGSSHRFFGDVLTPNSIAFSPDDKIMYFSDTRRFKIWAFDLDIETGDITNRRLFRDTTGHAGRPDGATVDSEGYLWTAEFAGSRIVRYAPDGSIDREIAVPALQPTSVAFGGKDLRTLFITTARLNLTDEQLAAQPEAGNILAIDLDIAGLEEPRFG